MMIDQIRNSNNNDAKRNLPEARSAEFSVHRLNRIHKYLHAQNLTDEEFSKIIDEECETFLAETPPIQEEFNPATELSSMRSLPQKERQAALEDFKDKLSRQRHAYMKCRLLIEQSIMHNNDLNPSNLFNILQKFSKAYGFPTQSRQMIRDLICDYYGKRDSMHKLRRDFPDDSKLIEAITEMRGVAGDATRIMMGPVSFDIITNREIGERIYKKFGSKPDFHPGGFQTSAIAKDVLFTVTITDSPVRQILKHEQEHATNVLLGKYFDRNDPRRYTSIEPELERERDPKRRRELIETQLSVIRDGALDRARDEIVAMFKDGMSDDFDKRFTNKDGGPYDYLEHQRAEFENYPEWAEASREILVEQYEKIIKKALKAFKELTNAGHYSNDEAIALLTDAPLKKWPSMARHLQNSRLNK